MTVLLVILRGSPRIRRWAALAVLAAGLSWALRREVRIPTPGTTASTPPHTTAVAVDSVTNTKINAEDKNKAATEPDAPAATEPAEPGRQTSLSLARESKQHENDNSEREKNEPPRQKQRASFPAEGRGKTNTSSVVKVGTTCRQRAGDVRFYVGATTGFPTTPFTEYIRTTLAQLLPDPGACDVQLRLSPAANHTVAVETLRAAGRTGEYLAWVWTRAFERVFAPGCGRVLPGSVVLGLQGSRETQTPDFADEVDHQRRCFAHSSPGGNFSVPNFLSLKAMIEHPHELNNYLPPPPPFEKRHATPIWRGSPWGGLAQIQSANKQTTPAQAVEAFYQVLPPEKHMRIPLIGFSIRNPGLLNARGSNHGDAPLYWPSFKYNDSISLEQVLPTDKIPEVHYYNEHRVVVVLGGHGAAYRLADHLAQGSAVVLQDFAYREWFARYLRPFAEYVPLARDLADLAATLTWVRDHPAEVRDIAARGRAFHARYLAYGRLEEFLYELAYRLAEAQGAGGAPAARDGDPAATVNATAVPDPEGPRD